MYSKFVFGNFDTQSLNKRQRHPRGAFLDVFDGTNINSVLWYSKKRIYQDKVKVTEQNGATNKYIAVVITLGKGNLLTIVKVGSIKLRPQCYTSMRRYQK